MSDEHPVFMTGCYGHRSVRTPVIDALAASGAVFDAAYCPSPICAPSRAAMMTGRHVHEIEVWDNASPLRSDWPTFAHSFSAAGYRTALCGKMHFVGPDQHHGFAERWTKDIYPASFDWTRSNRAGPAVNEGQNIDRVFETGPGWTPDMDYDEAVVARAEYGLRRWLRRKSPSPFLLCVSLTGPHFPYRAPRKYWDLYTDQDIDLPHLPPGFAAREHTYVQWLRVHGRMQRRVPDHICRSARHAILARITMVDDYFGRLLELLTQEGADHDAIVVYASDHGDMMGEHGLWFKNAAFEWSSRVPWILRAPDVAGQRISEVVSLLDLGPTLCGLAGITPVYPLSGGRDLSPLLLGRRRPGQGLAIMENYAEGVWRGWRMVRRGRFKLVYVPGYRSELYDVVRDPDEWHDLAAQPRFAGIRRRLEALALRDWDPDACDERRWQSEERRLAILRAGRQPDWHCHPLSFPRPASEDLT